MSRLPSPSTAPGRVRRSPSWRALLVAAVAALGGAWTAAFQAPPQASGVLVVRGGTLIDGTGRSPVHDAVIVMEAGRIREVGPASLPTPAGAAVVDATGKFILPGLIDTHVHYRDWLGEMFLAHGVTSVFDSRRPGRLDSCRTRSRAPGTAPGTTPVRLGQHPRRTLERRPRDDGRRQREGTVPAEPDDRARRGRSAPRDQGAHRARRRPDQGVPGARAHRACCRGGRGASRRPRRVRAYV